MDKRITNPSLIDRAQISEEIASGNRVILQYSEPSYSSRDLIKINELCIEFGSSLEARFFGHYGQSFDAENLRYLPDVQALSLDCLQEISNAETLSQLQNLRRLSFGVYQWEDSTFLGSLKLSSIEQIAVGDTRRNNLDLLPLRGCNELKEMYLVGHISGIEKLSDLPALQSLSLGSIPKKQNLEFVSAMASLRKLVVILGGRKNISEITHAGLEELQILRVRGFDNINYLDAFPSLRLLVIEDQIQLASVPLTEKNGSLETVRIFNCKNLSAISGLASASKLRSLRIGTTAIAISSILSQELPKSLKTIALNTGSKSKNAEIRKQLDSLGYSENEMLSHTRTAK